MHCCTVHDAYKAIVTWKLAGAFISGLLTAAHMICRHQVPYLMHVNERVQPFSRGCAANLRDYFAWRRERHWELPSTEELIERHISAGRVCGLC